MLCSTSMHPPKPFVSLKNIMPVHHIACLFQEAALEKAKAGEGRNVEHVALEDDATLTLADTQRPKRTQRKRKQAQAADHNGAVPSAEPREAAKPRRAKQKQEQQALETEAAQPEPEIGTVQQTKQARRGRRRAHVKAPLPAGQSILAIYASHRVPAHVTAVCGKPD